MTIKYFFENKAKFKTFKGFYSLIIFMVFNKLNLVAKYYNYKIMLKLKKII